MREPPDLRALHAAAASQGMAGKQSAFAGFVGWDKSHVTRLKQRGQIVVRDDGLVDYAASLELILGNADPSRDAQRQRAAERRPEPPARPPLDDGAPPEGESSDAMAYATARARKEHWQAEQARIDYERSIGTLVPRVDVEAAIDDASAVFRSALDNLPHRVAPELVGQEVDTIRAILRGEVQAVLQELTQAFASQVAQAAQRGAA